MGDYIEVNAAADMVGYSPSHTLTLAHMKRIRFQRHNRRIYVNVEDLRAHQHQMALNLPAITKVDRICDWLMTVPDRNERQLWWLAHHFRAATGEKASTSSVCTARQQLLQQEKGI